MSLQYSQAIGLSRGSDPLLGGASQGVQTCLGPLSVGRVKRKDGTFVVPVNRHVELRTRSSNSGYNSYTGRCYDRKAVLVTPMVIVTVT